MAQDRSEYMRNYQRRWLAQRRARVVAQLGGQCAKCGTTENLEVDHINPATKSPKLRSSGTGNFWSWRWELVLEELAQCQLLCHQHHVEKTRANNEYLLRARRGEASPKAKLTQAQVQEIRKSDLPTNVLGRQYDVHWATISKIRLGRRWKEEQ